MARTSKKVKDPDNYLSFGKLMLWKSSDVAAAWVNVIMLSFLSIYASDTLGLNTALVGALLMGSKIVDAFTDILAGWLVDNTKTKLGKGRPYEICILGQTICTVLLFMCNPAWSNTIKCVWLFLAYTLTFSIFATFRNAANNPYTIRAFSNKPGIIRKVASYGGIITMGASIVLNMIFPGLVEKYATSASGWTLAVAMVMIPASLIGILRFIFVKEDPSVDAETNQEKINIKELVLLFSKNKYVWLYAIIMLAYNLMTNLAVNTYYFKWVIGNMGMMGVMSAVSMVVLPVMLFFPKIMQKMGSMCKMISMFCVIGIAGYLLAFFSAGWLPGVLIGVLLGSLATTPLAYYGVLFIMNICTYNEMIGLPRMDGSSGILSNFSSKAGASLGSLITGLVLMLGGYASGEGVTEQSASAIMAIRVDFAIVPIVCLVIIIICCLAFVKLEKDAAAFEAAKRQAAEVTE